MADRREFLTDRFATPIGELAIMADGDGRLRGLAWGDRLPMDLCNRDERPVHNVSQKPWSKKEGGY